MADMDQVVAELKRIRELLEGRAGRCIAKGMLPLIHEGEAVVPKSWNPSCSLRSTTGTRLALCRKVSAQVPDLMCDRATGTLVSRSSATPDLANEVRALRGDVVALRARSQDARSHAGDRPVVEPVAQGVHSSPSPTQQAPLSHLQARNPGDVV
ncbi:hypothetical protein [Acidovorax sp.]|uniref:hypothetical protein n=1 Tax=Acidovorax sp. TaxID=1872122 RepID=UPI0025C40F4C|nr:hypothetical protein [Acidovorax sp.]MBW8464840.1 hypothetical protein [Acidovorax sp.]